MYSCEYLPRLATIAIKIQIHEENPELKAISLDGSTLSISTSRSAYNALLPIDHKLVSDILPKITNLNVSPGVLSAKLVVSLPKSQDLFMALANSSHQKWSVKDLLKTPRNENNINTFSFACKYCNETVVESAGSSFSDMPSEFWHELMDFWHCHKPHQDHHLKHTKDYDQIHAKPNHVYIGSSYLLTYQDQPSSQCPRCNAVLGDVTGTHDVKLHKWNLLLTFSGHTESYPPASYAYYAILDKVNSGGSRKLLIKPAGPNSPGLFVWVMNLGLSVSFLHELHSNALKLLYTNGDEPAIDDELVEVPREVYDDFHLKLVATTGKLPESERSLVVTDDGRKRSFTVGYFYVD